MWPQPRRAAAVQFDLDEIQRDRIMVQELVSRFRSSHHRAALSFANFGIKGTLATL